MWGVCFWAISEAISRFELSAVRPSIFDSSGYRRELFVVDKSIPLVRIEGIAHGVYKMSVVVNHIDNRSQDKRLVGNVVISNRAGLFDLGVRSYDHLSAAHTCDDRGEVRAISDHQVKSNGLFSVIFGKYILWHADEYPRALSLICRCELLLSDPSLAQRETSIYKNESGSDFRPTKLLAVVGGCVLIFSFALLSQVVDKINLDSSCNDYICVGGFFLALTIFLIGGWLFLAGIGLAPSKLFGHTL